MMFENTVASFALVSCEGFVQHSGAACLEASPDGYYSAEDDRPP